MNDYIYYDIIIIGAGLSGLALAQEFLKRTNKKVLIIEKKKKFDYDKNWCFWNFPKNFFSNKYNNSWSKINIFLDNKKITLKDGKIKYLRLRSIDFYKKIEYLIKKNKNSELKMGQNIIKVFSEGGFKFLQTKNRLFKSKIIFDSRPNFKSKPKGLMQHFYGIELNSKKPVFNEKEVTLMDFQSFKNKVHFFYILPFSKKNALIETTYFSNKLYTKTKYKNDIKKYIKKKFGDINFKETFCEKGLIPMYKIYHKQNSKNLIKIGTAGNWVKPSTGYSFQNSFINAEKIVTDVLQDRIPNLNNNKFLNLLDEVFCLYINKYPENSRIFFLNFFSKNNFVSIVSFLIGISKFNEILKIIFSLPKIYLIKCFFILLKKKVFYEKSN